MSITGVIAGTWVDFDGGRRATLMTLANQSDIDEGGIPEGTIVTLTPTGIRAAVLGTDSVHGVAMKTMKSTVTNFSKQTIAESGSLWVLGSTPPMVQGGNPDSVTHRISVKGSKSGWMSDGTTSVTLYNIVLN